MSTASVTFLPTDTKEEKLWKAAHVKPSPQQLDWMDKEITAFIHFSPNTFTGRQWGNGTETPADFHPSDPDPEQWIRVCAEAGMKHAITTLKHHDGFCLWPTESTDFSVSATEHPLDYAKALSEACAKYGVGFGVYLSPWDMHQREAGIWNTPAYNDMFLKQLEELLTRYGKVEEVWFDGACGDYPIWQAVPCYQTKTWYDMIHRLQPDCVYRMYDPHFLASEEEWEKLKAGEGELSWSGRAVRWVGNEDGISREEEWGVQPVFERQIAKNATFPDLGAPHYYDEAVGAVWYPVEVNTTITNEWFWNPETTKVKSLERLIETYYQSVGNNGVLLLNLSPDRTGRIPQDQVERLMELRSYIDRTFAENLAEGAKTTRTGYSVLVELDGPKTFDQVLVQEMIEEGQRVAEWSLEVWKDGEFREVARHHGIGHKNIRRFEKITTDKVRFHVIRSNDEPLIKAFGLYLSADLSSDR